MTTHFISFKQYCTHMQLLSVSLYCHRTKSRSPPPIIHYCLIAITSSGEKITGVKDINGLSHSHTFDSWENLV